MITATEVVNHALALGYDKCGIVDVSAMHGFADKVDERIARFPDISEKSQFLYGFAKPEVKYPWAKSVIICASWYGNYKIPDTVKGRIGKFYLTDSRRDKNANENTRSLAFEKYLKDNGMQLATERDFAVTSLRWAAMQAGIGTIRQNNFFYTDRGSWVILEAFLVDASLEHILQNDIRPCPTNCRICINSCPTKSLSAPFEMHRNSCVSCLTTFNDPDYTESPYSKGIGNWIFGCDVCQDVCPFNKGAWQENEDFPLLAEICESLTLSQIVTAEYDFLRDVVQPKLWYIPVTKLWKYKTNALNAMHNNYHPEYLSAITLALEDENEEVRKTAKWVLHSLDKQAPSHAQ